MGRGVLLKARRKVLRFLHPEQLLYGASRKAFGTITHCRTEEPLIALTFDDGPDPLYTPMLLDVLEQYGAGATFFMVGTSAAAHPSLVKRVAEGGHDIGNHTWSHVSMRLTPPGLRREEIIRCRDALAPYGKKFFRPPFGHQTVGSRFDAFLLGYHVVTWNLVARDWLGDSAPVMVERLRKDMEPGNIILFHDRLDSVVEERFIDRAETCRAVELLLQACGATYTFVTLSELFQRSTPVVTKWFKKHDRQWISDLQKTTATTMKAGVV
jgi:peptidoglycan-N-acetylglucosamine deacetylase